MIVRSARHPDPVLLAVLSRAAADLMTRHPVAPIVPVEQEITAPPVGVSAVIGWTAFETGLAVDDILGDSRLAKLVRARAAIAWVANLALGRGANQIGRLLGNRHHATIINALRKAESLRGRDPAFVLLTDRLLERIEQEREAAR